MHKPPLNADYKSLPVSKASPSPISSQLPVLGWPMCHLGGSETGWSPKGSKFLGKLEKMGKTSTNIIELPCKYLQQYLRGGSNELTHESRIVWPCLADFRLRYTPIYYHHHIPPYLGVSWNGGTFKSSSLMGCSIIPNHFGVAPFVSIYGNPLLVGSMLPIPLNSLLPLKPGLSWCGWNGHSKCSGSRSHSIA